MYRIFSLGLFACLTVLAFILTNHQSEPFVSLIVAPAIGLIGCTLLVIVALCSIVRPARQFNGGGSSEGSEA